MDYTIEHFYGIDQSQSENKMNEGFTPDARNMDTENGDLAVAKGYVKHFTDPIPGSGTIHRMYLWHRAGTDIFVVAAGNSIYAYLNDAWSTIYTYAETIAAIEWDFQEVRIGASDYLIIANGQTQLVKWSGTGNAEIFGSGEYVYEGEIASVTHNMVKATSMQYEVLEGVYMVEMPQAWEYATNARILLTVPQAVKANTAGKILLGYNRMEMNVVPSWAADDLAMITLPNRTSVNYVLIKTAASVSYDDATGIYTLTMPDGWAYAGNAEIAMSIPMAPASAQTIKITVGGNTHTLAARPTWTAGDMAIIKLESQTTATVSTDYTPVESVKYSDKVGLYKLVMPQTWTYTENEEIAISTDETTATVDAAYIVINSGYRKLNYAPSWEKGSIGTVKLVSTSAAEVSANVYGINGITLDEAIPEGWKQRALDVGAIVAGVTRPLSAVSNDRLTITPEETITDELSAGDAVEVRGGVSDAPVNYLEVHYSRLFTAGDTRYPSRLYWSQPPGDTRTIEDWSMDDASDVTSGGHTDVGNTSGDPITGICSLSNQLIIFKKNSVYRLLGDRPNNYQIVPVNLDVERMYNSGRVLNADVPYWITRIGMYYHDGQRSHLTGTARQIQYILRAADLTRCKACLCRDRMYFTCKLGEGTYDDSIIVYDATERAYMVRDGFTVIDICAREGVLYMINDARIVYRFNEGDTYDGTIINAYWNTPMTDLASKSTRKQPKLLYVRGTGEKIIFTVSLSDNEDVYPYLMPLKETDVLKIPLKNEGRALKIRIENEAGSHFKLTGGIEIKIDLKKD